MKIKKPKKAKRQPNKKDFDVNGKPLMFRATVVDDDKESEEKCNIKVENADLPTI